MCPEVTDDYYCPNGVNLVPATVPILGIDNRRHHISTSTRPYYETELAIFAKSGRMRQLKTSAELADISPLFTDSVTYWLGLFNVNKAGLQFLRCLRPDLVRRVRVRPGPAAHGGGLGRLQL